MATAIVAATTGMAAAACPQELAVYSDPDKSLTLEFSPNNGEMMTVSNKFRVAMKNDIVLDGILETS